MPRKRTTPLVDDDAFWGAVTAVKSGQMTIRGAAAQYGVPKSTLADHKKDVARPSRVVQGRFRHTFDDAQEQELVDFIIGMSKRFYAMTRLVVPEKVY